MTHLSRIRRQNRHLPRVEILGVFGSGKTLLAKQLVGAGIAQGAYEHHERNPFWGRTLELDAVSQLAYELSFLVDHVECVTRLTKPTPIVCDWSFESDRLWAEMRLDPAGLRAYSGAHGGVVERLGPATVYVHLQLGPDLVYTRLRKRARAPERALSLSRLRAASAALNALVEHLPPARVFRLKGEMALSDVLRGVASIMSARTGAAGENNVRRLKKTRTA